ncbi:MAG TPA: hypothetical protein PKE29_03440 [Phycisphaerales bacterium]|nr:hypothetical protein [Phycisphaerales bacterium]
MDSPGSMRCHLEKTISGLPSRVTILTKHRMWHAHLDMAAVAGDPESDEEKGGAHCGMTEAQHEARHPAASDRTGSPKGEG